MNRPRLSLAGWVVVAAALALGSLGSASPVAIQPGSARYDAEGDGSWRVRLHLVIAEPYHIYGTVPAIGPRGQGPTATAVRLDRDAAAVVAGPVTTSLARKAFDPNFDLELESLEGRAWIEVPLKMKPGAALGEHRMDLAVEFQACTPESCLPPETVRVPVVVTVRPPGTSPARSTRTADEAFAEFRAVSAAGVTVLNDRVWSDRLGPTGRDELMAASGELTVAVGEKLLADFPEDARRWSVMAALLRVRRTFPGPGQEGMRDAWRARREAWRDALVSAPDVPEGLVASVLELAVYASLGGRWADPGSPPDPETAARTADRMRSRVPASDRRKFAEQHLIEHWIEHKAWDRAEARLRSLVETPEENPAVTTMATGLLKKLALRREPLDMRFIALDGTPFDLAALRGKVVLIDFWATWCVPCMEEMPEIKRVYAKYRDQGFEVVGVSFDSLPRDPAKPRFQERTPEQVQAFVAREGMVWPHYFDGKGWDNAWGRAFSIAELPTGFLLDRSGRLVHLDNHGSKLEANVRSLLGL